jgi:hypothetical protein
MEHARANLVGAAVKPSPYRRIDRSRHSQRTENERKSLVGAAAEPCHCRNGGRKLYSRRHVRVSFVYAERRPSSFYSSPASPYLFSLEGRNNEIGGWPSDQSPLRPVSTISDFSLHNSSRLILRPGRSSDLNIILKDTLARVKESCAL